MATKIENIVYECCLLPLKQPSVLFLHSDHDAPKAASVVDAVRRQFSYIPHMIGTTRPSYSEEYGHEYVWYGASVHGLSYDSFVLHRPPETSRELDWIKEVVSVRMTPGGRIFILGRSSEVASCADVFGSALTAVQCD